MYLYASCFFLYSFLFTFHRPLNPILLFLILRVTCSPGWVAAVRAPHLKLCRFHPPYTDGLLILTFLN